MRDLLLVLHIVGVATWLGANVVQFLSTKRLVAQGGQVAAAWTGMTVLWARILYMPASILILATGTWLVLETGWEFSHGFVSVGFTVVIIGAVLGIVVFAKAGERASAAFAAGDDATGTAEVNKVIPWAILDSALIVVAIIAMVGKWGV
jgi:hypothetical protein